MNDEWDSVNEIISAFEASLKKLNLGLSVWSVIKTWEQDEETEIEDERTEPPVRDRVRG